MSAQVIDLANRYPGKYRREDYSKHTEPPRIDLKIEHESNRGLWFCVGVMAGFLLAVVVTRL